MRILLTGAAGFIGSHVLDDLLRTTEDEIITLDRLGSSGTWQRIAELPSYWVSAKRVTLLYHDLKSPIGPHLDARIGPIDIVFHLAAGSHVDYSIANPLAFVYDNIVGTANLLEWARQRQGGLRRFFYFSTDEVFGPAPPGVRYKEWDRYHSGNPYAATKAGAEELALAFHNTYRLPVIVTHTMNVFGERQQPEKFIPSTIGKVLRGEPVIIHADQTRTKPGSRFYIYAGAVASALDHILSLRLPVGEKYNIVGEREVSNLEVAQMIADELRRPLQYSLVDFHSSRPGHDLRYALDGSKMASLGWQPPEDFETSFRRIVRWYVENPRWLQSQ